MLTVHDQRRGLGEIGRRDFLRIGTLGLGGLTLADMQAVQAALRGKGGAVRDKSVIFLFMHGGPSQFETFDPKMDAPSNIRSATGEVKTTIPGVTFGGTFQKLARLADKFSIVRSFVTGDGNHDIKPVVGKDSLKANLGSLYARVAGAMRKGSTMPNNVALFPRSVDPGAGPAITNFGDFASAGEVGAAYRPVVPGAGGGLLDDLRLNVSQERLDDRRGLLAAVDQWRRRIESNGAVAAMSEIEQQAFSVLSGGLAGAFDLSAEDPKVIARYDTSALVPRDRISKKWNNHGHYGDHASTLGKLLLLARRLCERGCGFVTVTTSFVWDMHADQNNATLTEGMGYVGTPFDHAVAAFIEDVEQRGLSEKILLVCCGEMGRSPSINAAGGRDHWGNLAPLMLYGGGLKMGRVIGQSTRNGGEPASDPVTIRDLNATIMHTLLDIGEARLLDDIPKNVMDAISAGTPIRGLI
jgi:Protein of unknown function (DUF1501)